MGIAQGAKMAKLLLTGKIKRVKVKNSLVLKKKSKDIKEVCDLYLPSSIYQFNASWNSIHMNQTWRFDNLIKISICVIIKSNN